MILYTGRRVLDRCLVDVAEADGSIHPLALRLDLANHSPTGFEWGYAGSGPAQLALAILAHHSGDRTALLLHQIFKQDVVARFDKTWSLTDAGIAGWLGAPHG